MLPEGHWHDTRAAAYIPSPLRLLPVLVTRTRMLTGNFPSQVCQVQLHLQSLVGTGTGTGKTPLTALTGRTGPFKLPRTLNSRSRMLPAEHCTGMILAAAGEYILSPSPLQLMLATQEIGFPIPAVFRFQVSGFSGNGGKRGIPPAVSRWASWSGHTAGTGMSCRP